MDMELKKKIEDSWSKYDNGRILLGELFKKVREETGANDQQILIVSHIMAGCHYGKWLKDL